MYTVDRAHMTVRCRATLCLSIVTVKGRRDDLSSAIGKYVAASFQNDVITGHLHCQINYNHQHHWPYLNQHKCLWLVVLVVEITCCHCLLLCLVLMLVLNFEPCACGVFYQLPHTLYLVDLVELSLVLQSVLVVFFHSTMDTHTPPAHMVVSPSATCMDSVFSSTHWHKHCTCTQATCTVWW